MSTGASVTQRKAVDTTAEPDIILHKNSRLYVNTLKDSFSEVFEKDPNVFIKTATSN